MKKLSIILFSALVTLAACTKSKEVHPELGDGNDEFLTVGTTTAHVEYTRADMAELQKVVFHYGLSGFQQFTATEMTKREAFFELTLNNLVSDTLYNYYYELFPMNGNVSTTGQKTFHTQFMDAPEPPTPPTPPSGTPEGAINGLFTINENGDQVYFSQGNLQYQASTNTWRFAENQWDYVGTQIPDSQGGWYGGTIEGSDNTDISQDYVGWIDLFGWGTSGWNCGNTYYQPWDHPWDVSISYNDLFGPPGQYDLTSSYVNSDWGYYNSISNGGNATHQWRTLTQKEWEYVINMRSTTSGIRYAKAMVNNVNGVILLPDNWSSSYYSLSITNIDDALFSSNVISSSSWVNFFEVHGAVFLPAAGLRFGADVLNVNCFGCYWSASCRDSVGAIGVTFNDDTFGFEYYIGRSEGRSVRLVCPAK